MPARLQVAIVLVVAAIAALAVTVGTFIDGSAQPAQPRATVTQKPPFGDPNSTAVINYDGEFLSVPYRGAAVKLTAADAVAAMHKNVSQGLAELAPGKPQVALRLVTYNSAGISASPEPGLTSAVDVTKLPAYVIIYGNSPILRLGGPNGHRTATSRPSPTPERAKCSFEGIVDANTGKVLTLNQDCS